MKTHNIHRSFQYFRLKLYSFIAQFKSMNKSEIVFNGTKSNPVELKCKYDDLITNPNDQIKWYFNKHRIRNGLSIDGSHANVKGDQTPNHQFTVVQTLSHGTNSTISTLFIHNFNIKYNYGKYKCQFKGLTRPFKIFSNFRNGLHFFVKF